MHNFKKSKNWLKAMSILFILYMAICMVPFKSVATADVIQSVDGFFPDTTGRDLGTFADVNGDRRSDYVVPWNNNGILYLTTYLANPDGTFQNGITSNTGAGFAADSTGRPLGIFADVNGDRRSEFIVPWSNNGILCLTTYLANPNGTFQNGITSNTGGGFAADSIGRNLGSFADVNGDGRSEFVVPWNNNGILYLATYLPNPNGTFQNGIINTNTGRGFVADSTGRFLGTFADVSGDGRADYTVVWNSNGIRSFTTYLANPDGTFQDPITKLTPGDTNGTLLNNTGVNWYYLTTPSDWKAVFLTLTPITTTGLTNSELKVQIYDSKTATTPIVNNYVSATGIRYANYASTSSKILYVKVSGNNLTTARNYRLNLDIHDPNYDLGITPIKQEQNQWCWVACGKMAGEYYWKKLHNYASGQALYTQTQIAQKVITTKPALYNYTGNGNYNLPGWAYDSLQYVIEGSMTNNSSLYKSTNVLSDAEIFDKLVTYEQPTIPWVGNTNGTAGHFVVIRKFQRNSDGTAQITINDPWYGDTVTVDTNVMRNSGFRPGDYRTWNSSSGYTVVTDRKVGDDL